MEHAFSPDLVGHCWMELRLPDSFSSIEARVESALFFFSISVFPFPPPSVLFELPFHSNLTHCPLVEISWRSDNQLVIWVQRSIAIINHRILEPTKASTPPSGNSNCSIVSLSPPSLIYLKKKKKTKHTFINLQFWRAEAWQRSHWVSLLFTFMVHARKFEILCLVCRIV